MLNGADQQELVLDDFGQFCGRYVEYRERHGTAAAAVVRLDRSMSGSAGVRHPEMAGVAADEEPVVAGLVRHQPPPDPVLLAQQFVFEVAVDAEHGADRGIAVDGVEIGDAGIEMDMNQPGHLPSIA
jgi:hypothetical protein